MGEAPQTREEIRAWLEANVPPGWREQLTGASEDSYVAFQHVWLGKLRDAGLAAPHWPQEAGGGARSLQDQFMIYEEIARARAPRAVLHLVSLYHTAMTLLEWGSEAQRQQHLPNILAGQVWCQGFSEPNAGSDLASLRTKAERRGDVYVVNGQKIWSTGGHLAEWCILLARTDPQASKHRGISFLLVDLKSPGVEVRPIRQITGDPEFSELFFTDLEVPVANLVGPEGEGWRVAQATLSSERGTVMLEHCERLALGLEMLIALARKTGGARDAQIRRRIADIYTRQKAMRALVGVLMTGVIENRNTALEASAIKVFYSLLLRDLTALALKLEGPGGLVRKPSLLGGGDVTGNWMVDYFNSWLWTIAGGTNEIQRNIIAERRLGMPREATP